MKKNLFSLLLLLSLAIFSFLTDALAEFKTPQNTVVIEEEAFMGNTSLSTITLNDGLKRIESNAFSNCDLQEAHLPASVEYIAEDAFDGNNDMILYAPSGSYAWKWANDHHYWFDWNVEASWLDCYTVTWEPIEGISNYVVNVYTDEALQNLYVSYSFDDNENTHTGYVNTDVGTRYYFTMGYIENDQQYFLPHLPGYVKTADPIEPLRAPDNLQWRVVGPQSVGISWDPIENVRGYRLYWSETPEWTPSTDFVSSYDEANWGGIDLSNPGIQMNGFEQNQTIYIWICADNEEGPNYRAMTSITFFWIPDVGGYYAYLDSNWTNWIHIESVNHDTQSFSFCASWSIGNNENEYTATAFWNQENYQFKYETTSDEGNASTGYIYLENNKLIIYHDSEYMGEFHAGSMVESINLFCNDSLNFDEDGNIKLYVGETIQLQTNVHPVHAAFKNVFWYSDNPTSVQIDQTGQITALAASEHPVYISATAFDNWIYDHCFVKVYEPEVAMPAVGNYYQTDVDPEYNIGLLRILDLDFENCGIKFKTYMVGNASNDHTVWAYWDENCNTNGGFVFETEDDNGNTQEGFLTLDDNGVFVKRHCIEEQYWSWCTYRPGVPVYAVSMSAHNIMLVPGATMQLTAKPSPVNATIQKMWWSSSDESIATIDENGLVTAVKAGSTYVYASSNDNHDIYDYCLVTVTNWDAAPMDVTATSMGNEVSLSWIGAAGKYTVYEKINNKLTKVINVTGETAVLQNVSQGSHVYVIKPRRITEENKTEYGSASEEVTVDVAGETSSSRRHIALLIGNGDYNQDGDTNDKGDLRGPKSDVTSFSNALTGLNPSWEVTAKIDLTSSEMLSWAGSVFAGSSSDDICLFYYSGHGSYGGLLCGVGDGPYLQPTELAKKLNEITKGKVIVILDSCYSGGVITPKSGSSLLSSFNSAVISAFSGYTITPEIIPKSGELMVENKFYVLTASASYQMSYEISFYDTNEGLMTIQLLDALGCCNPAGSFEGNFNGDSNGDSKLTLGEAKSFIVQEIENIKNAHRSYCLSMKNTWYDTWYTDWEENHESEYYDTYDDYFDARYNSTCSTYDQITTSYGDNNFVMFER